MIANIVRICQGFLDTGSPSESIAYFNDSSKPTSVIRSCVFDAQSLLLDGVVVSLLSVYPRARLNMLPSRYTELGWYGGKMFALYSCPHWHGVVSLVSIFFDRTATLFLTVDSELYRDQRNYTDSL